MTPNNREKSLGYAIGRTNWYIKTLISKLLKEEGFSITNEQWIVLKAIASNPNMSQTEIAEKSLKDKTNITRILDLLEKSTYIERRKDDMDRRMNRIHITQQGRRILKAVNPVIQKTDEICSLSQNKKDVRELIKLLDVICSGIKERL